LAPPIAASLILPAIFWGQNYVPVQPYGLIFSVFPFLYRFGSFLLLFCSFSSFLFNFFLFISSYILNCLRHLIFFSSYILNCLLYCRHEISIILRGFFEGAKPFLIHLRSKLMYTMRPCVLTFLFYPFLMYFDLFFLLLSSYSSLHISLLILLVLYSSSSYSSLLIFKLFAVLQTCILNTHWVKVQK
jgi:hypothetical protein